MQIEFIAVSRGVKRRWGVSSCGAVRYLRGKGKGVGDVELRCGAISPGGLGGCVHCIESESEVGGCVGEGFQGGIT